MSRLASPTGPDADRVASIAAGLIDELGLEPPIDLRVVASYQGVRDIRVSPSPWAGSLFADGDELVIQVRSTDGPRRRRFSGFHELGHTFMPGYRVKRQYRCDPSAPLRRDGVEALCDVAASELLFPARFFDADLDQTSFGTDGIEDLAERYDASFEATARRFVDRWPEPALLAVLEVRNKPADRRAPGAKPKLRVVYGHASGPWPFIPTHKSVTDESALYRVTLGQRFQGPSDLEGLATIGYRLEVSADDRSFVDPDGVLHDRVIAVFRAPGRAKPSPLGGEER
jgi:hypothetical protein